MGASVEASVYHTLQREVDTRSEPHPKQSRSAVSKAADDDDEDDDDLEGEEEEEEEEDENEDDASAPTTKGKVKAPKALETSEEVKRMRGLLDDNDDVQDDDEEGEDEDSDEEEDEIKESKMKKKNKAKTKEKVDRKPGYDLEEGRTVFVRNVPFEATEEDMRATFRKFGVVSSIKFVADKSGEHAHRGTAFVKFREADGATA